MLPTSDWDIPDIATLILFLLIIVLTELKPIFFKTKGLLDTGMSNCKKLFKLNGAIKSHAYLLL